MIGNLAEARVAVAKHYEGKRPVGWKKIGAGVSRTAYLSPTGVVYKVGEKYCNEVEHKEFARYRRWKSLASKGVYIPRSSLFCVEGEDILGVEYINGKSAYCKSWYDYTGDAECSCNPVDRLCYGVVLDWLGVKGMNDMHDDNMLVTNDGKMYVIDLGYN